MYPELHTQGTEVRPLRGLSSKMKDDGLLPMVPEVILSSKCLATEVTGERSFVRVCALVYQKIIRFGKVTTTVLANELFLGTENK